MVRQRKKHSLRSTNGNFYGLIGSTAFEIYLANPAVVVASSVAGCVTSPGGVLSSSSEEEYADMAVKSMSI